MTKLKKGTEGNEQSRGVVDCNFHRLRYQGGQHSPLFVNGKTPFFNTRTKRNLSLIIVEYMSLKEALSYIITPFFLKRELNL